MKNKKITLSIKDVQVLNRVKKFLNTTDSDISQKEIIEFNRLIKLINSTFNKPQPLQKFGKGSMVGLSGFTWDFSKMPADEAKYMQECLQSDIEHDKMMNPMKYIGNKPIKFSK